VTGEQIKEILLAGSYVSKEDIRKAELSAEAKGNSLLDCLIEQGLITLDIFGQAVSEFFQVTYADLNSYFPSSEQIYRIPEEIAKKFRVVLFSESEDEVVLATDFLREKEFLKEISDSLAEVFHQKKITLAYCLSEDMEKVLVCYQKALETRFAKIMQEKGKIAPEIIAEIFNDAFVFQASDIHFEPQESQVVVRFRVDGVLHEAGKIPKKYYENIVNRIKVLAHIRIDEHFSAQDGAIRYVKEGKSFDMRVSIIPTLDGEKIVLRVLTGYVKNFTLSDLGLSAQNRKILEAASRKPFGMILVTGPTGSGKSTTLYALLKILNNPGINITTIEDPVEYKIHGINQIQVNTQTNLNFASGLRSIVRQDPDIILVGEIRDKETAEISVNAALTGHLLLSTFHSNDAATAMPRLFDMGIEPFLLASTLEVVIAQRLVRKICEQCKTSFSEDTSKLKKHYQNLNKYILEKKVTLYKGKGCQVCGSTGYKGRIALFEFIPVTPEMKSLALKNPSTGQVLELARKQGLVSLFEDGIEKVRSGLTTIEELYRVAPPAGDLLGEK
jgi:type II secretory ATPase GspE/PulE/Tfp pilus assembly ATPase PilB-like protein